MPWDEDDDRFIDYLAEHESGFMGGLPVRLVSFEDALRILVDEGDDNGSTEGSRTRRKVGSQDRTRQPKNRQMVRAQGRARNRTRSRKERKG